MVDLKSLLSDKKNLAILIAVIVVIIVVIVICVNKKPADEGFDYSQQGLTGLRPYEWRK